MSATDVFERLAALYYADTGYLAPGKDDPLNTRSMEERFAEFDAWQMWRLTRELPCTETWAEYRERVSA